MKLLTTLLLLSISLLASAQKCKYEVNELDKFTNKMTKETKKEMIVNAWDATMYFQARREGDAVYLIFEFWHCEYKKVEMPKIQKGQKILFLLADGSKIELECADDITGQPKNYVVAIPPTYCSILYNASYPANAEQVDKLLKNTISTIRFYKTEGNGKEDYKDYEIKKKNNEDLIELLKCVL
jgi:hypothetical protein